MRKFLIIICMSMLGLAANAQQKILLTEGKFKTGDEATWSKPSYNDADWKIIKANTYWEDQGIKYDGYAWYRFHINMPSALKDKSILKDTLLLSLAQIDDCDEVYLNGVKVAKTGTFPTEAGGYKSAWSVKRNYHLALNKLNINWNADNVLAIKVYDGDGNGGIGDGTPYITVLDYIDGVAIDKNQSFAFGGNRVTKKLTLTNSNKSPIAGTLAVVAKNMQTGKEVAKKVYPVAISAKGKTTIPVAGPNEAGVALIYTFTERRSGKSFSDEEYVPYILTPKAPATPRINGAQITGVRPGSPFLYKVAATGNKPLRYAAEGLPEGLKIDNATGIITGTLANAGEYEVQLTVTNVLGKSSRALTIKVGDLLALTPAMGWNSWNCWGLSVTEEKVKSSAQALIDKGLIDHGWTYINIDDAWEAEARNADGKITANKKFPDMKGLGDWLHGHGLKFGIYSSPGRLTCGGYLGSLDHELQDAETYNSWGIDYLKHDWCSYWEVAGKDTSLLAYTKPYTVMQKALRAQPRDIYYSLCQYGMKDVWKWGPDVDANSWRTTGDIVDTWQSLHDIGFSQYKISDYAKPGRWNDPDMLIVGKVGWSGTLHNTRLTPDEQYTHITLWSLLASPLLIGCDISQMDDFTLNLLTNDEVIAVNQDVLGKQAHRLLAKDGYEVYVKDLADGTKAVGVFNLNNDFRTVSIDLSEIGLNNSVNLRDVWRQKDLGRVSGNFSVKLAPHGTMMVKAK